MLIRTLFFFYFFSTLMDWLGDNTACTFSTTEVFACSKLPLKRMSAAEEPISTS